MLGVVCSTETVVVRQACDAGGLLDTPVGEELLRRLDAVAPQGSQSSIDPLAQKMVRGGNPILSIEVPDGMDRPVNLRQVDALRFCQGVGNLGTPVVRFGEETSLVLIS